MKLWFVLILASQMVHASSTQVGESVLKSKLGTPLFKMVKENEASSESLRYRVRFLDDTDTTLSEEHVVLAPDGALQSYQWTQTQTGQNFRLLRDKNKWKLSLDGKKDSIKIPSADVKVLVPPVLSEGLVREWEKDNKLQEFRFKLLAPDRMELFSFVFRRTKNVDDEVLWLLEPENFFVRLIVGQIYFLYSQDRVLKEVRDFTPPIKLKDENGTLKTHKTTVKFSL